MSIIAKNYIDSTIGDYYQLLKPRVMYLVVFTAAVGMILAPGNKSWFLSLSAIFSIALGTGAAGAFNMWYENDIDKIMNRTKNRPIPSGKIPVDDGLTFSILCAIFSLMIMFLVGGFIPTYMLAFAMFFYAIIYTILLKPYTSQNIVIGGAAGAFPPIIGWHFISDHFSIVPIILFTIIFLWTPPHFWALALKSKDDYSKANIPMMPIVAGNKSTKLQMLIYVLLLYPTTLSLHFFGYASVFFISITSLLTSYFSYLCYKLYKDDNETYAMYLFYYSIFYLFAIFLALVIEKFIN